MNFDDRDRIAKWWVIFILPYITVYFLTEGKYIDNPFFIAWSVVSLLVTYFVVMLICFG